MILNHKKISLKRTIVSVFMLLIVACVFFACSNRRSANTPAWGDFKTGLILKYQLPRDQVLKYSHSRDLVRTVNMVGQSIDTKLNSDINYSIKGTGLDDQNNLLIQVTINDINCSVGPIKPDNSGLNGKSFNATYSTNGEQLMVSGTENLPKVVFMPGAEQDVKYMFLDILPGLPDAAVKKGESWITPMDAIVEMDQLKVTYKGKATSVFEGIETIQGMECVKIKTHAKSAVEGSGTQMGQALNVKGDATATSTWYFAYKKGVLVRSTMDVNEDIKINMGAMEIPRTTKGKVETELVL